MKKNNKKEIDTIANYFLSDQNNGVICYGGDIVFFDKLIPFFDNLQPYERPDTYSKIDNTILILEHFEFDSTKVKKRGNKTRREFSRLDNSFNDLSSVKEITLHHNVVHCSQSIENYIKNSLNTLNKHYKKIGEYKQHLLDDHIANKKTKFIVCFFIENSDALGTLYMKKGKDEGPKTLMLFNCKEFLDIFEKMPELDCAITVNKINMKVNMSFITHKSLNLRRKDELKSDEIKIIDMGSNIQTCGFIIPISKNK